MRAMCLLIVPVVDLGAGAKRAGTGQRLRRSFLSVRSVALTPLRPILGRGAATGHRPVHRACSSTGAETGTTIVAFRSGQDIDALLPALRSLTCR